MEVRLIRNGDYISVAEETLSRSGALMHIGIRAAVADAGTIVSASYRCDIKNGNFLLMAAPLSFNPSIRQLRAGANIVDLSIQGYIEGRQSQFKRHFNYLFSMAKLRAAEYISKIPETERDDFNNLCESWVSSIENLKNNDLEGLDFSRYDKILENSIRVRFFTPSGSVLRAAIKMDSLNAAQWLANYTFDE